MRIFTLKIAFFLLVALQAISFAGGMKTSVFDTKHNFSTTGKGDIKSLTETRVCIFCHSSHNSSKEGPLWNHKTTIPSKFQTYNRSSLKSTPEQPNGATKLCLSCHDGTIAVGAVKGFARPIQLTNTGNQGEIPAGKKSNLGMDLRGTHPVSVRFDQSLAVMDKNLLWPPSDPENEVGVDSNGYIQCTSCHDPHGSRSSKYPFWKKATFSEVCLVCHKY
ncbi:MAG: cytochrome c3 family protein [candidate division Zixibacteria bacterium]